MREIFFTEKRVKDENGKKLNLGYYITVNEIESESGVVFESYGVKILLDRDGEQSEIAEINNIFFNSLEIHELIMVLSRYTVMPMSLHEIMDDYLADYGGVL